MCAATTGDKAKPEYQLDVVQEPIQARMPSAPGSGGPSGVPEFTCPTMTHSLFCFASLVSEHDDEDELYLMPGSQTSHVTGSVVSSLFHLKDQSCFVFPDLSVRTEGRWRFKMSMYEIVEDGVHFCKSLFTKPFQCYSSKRFPGMTESTELSKAFASQGLRLRIRRPNKSGEHDDHDDHDDDDNPRPRKKQSMDQLGPARRRASAAQLPQPPPPAPSGGARRASGTHAQANALGRSASGRRGGEEEQERRAVGPPVGYPGAGYDGRYAGYDGRQGQAILGYGPPPPPGAGGRADVRGYPGPPHYTGWGAHYPPHGGLGVSFPTAPPQGLPPPPPGFGQARAYGRGQAYGYPPYGGPPPTATDYYASRAPSWSAPGPHVGLHGAPPSPPPPQLAPIRSLPSASAHAREPSDASLASHYQPMSASSSSTGQAYAHAHAQVHAHAQHAAPNASLARSPPEPWERDRERQKERVRERERERRASGGSDGAAIRQTESSVRSGSEGEVEGRAKAGLVGGGGGGGGGGEGQSKGSLAMLLGEGSRTAKETTETPDFF